MATGIGEVVGRAGRRLAAVVVAVLAIGGGGAQAQEELVGFDVQQLNPMPSQHFNYFGLSSARPLPSFAWELGLFYHLADDPLVLEDADGERIQSIVHSQHTLNVLGGFGLGDIFDIGFDVPLILAQDGNTSSRIPQADDFDEAGFGLGDIRLVPKIQFFTTDTEESPGGVALALLVNTFIPTGESDFFRGEDFRIEPRLILEFAHARGTRFAINVGYMIRTADLQELQGIEVDDTLTFGMAAEIVANEMIRIVPELSGEASIQAEDLNSEEVPLEALLGLRVLPVEAVMLQLGGGTGLMNGFGAPDWRVFFGVHIANVPPKDTDLDGLYDDVDQCIESPEDHDGFEDSDGCPDVDNDQDGILDVYDDCPMDPEDIDQFEDENGCPDPDNDNDGLLDNVDQCPIDPEDIDGFEDSDGCPDRDNDNDGILDTADSCPMDPEDIDGWEDQDGCPDPDNDSDGILDVVDECPNVPENFNGTDDEDGCPDSIVVTCEEIGIREAVFFETDSDVIQSRSFDLLNQVAATINALPNIRLIRIEGHTDDRGSNAHNMDLSQRRAESVQRYLLGQGVNPSRVFAVGYGEDQPIASNRSSDGRAQNRRVQFRIMEQEGCEDTAPPPY